MVRHFTKDNFSLIDITTLPRRDQELILKWRNHPVIQQWIFSGNISIHDHFHFINKLKKSNSQQYWLVLKNHLKIGVVNLTFGKNKKTAKLGMYVVPHLIGKGYGLWMLRYFLAFIFHKLKVPKITLEVYENNLAALNLYRKCGFKPVYTHCDSQKGNLISMELS